jgi:hypothetical protein
MIVSVKFGLMDYWSNGLLDYWIIGSLDHWIDGVVEYWSIEKSSIPIPQ